MQDNPGVPIETPQRRVIVRRDGVKKASSLMRTQPLISTVMYITQYALRASASSILLCEEEGQKLIFLFADGPIGERMKRVKISKNSGIAGWVARNGKPLMENDASHSNLFNRFTDNISGFTTKSIICAPMFVKDRIIGVIELLNKLDDEAFDEHDLQALTVVADAVSRVLEHIERMQVGFVTHRTAISTLLSAVDAKNTFLRGHPKRVAEYAVMAANALSFSQEQRQGIEYASILHDIGKLSILDGTSGRSGALNDDAVARIKNHPVIGYKIIKRVPFLKEVGKLVLSHHERYDGGGYPQGLRENAIPVGARLIAVADAFDNLTAGNSGNQKMDKNGALAELSRRAGSQFDPAAIKAFKSGLIRSVSPG